MGASDIYLIGEDLDLVMHMEDVIRFDDMWNEGTDLFVIASRIGKDPDEIAILAVDRMRKGKIGQRQSGIWGNSLVGEVVNNGLFD